MLSPLLYSTYNVKRVNPKLQRGLQHSTGGRGGGGDGTLNLTFPNIGLTYKQNASPPQVLLFSI